MNQLFYQQQAAQQGSLAGQGKAAQQGSSAGHGKAAHQGSSAGHGKAAPQGRAALALPHLAHTAGQVTDAGAYPPS